LERDPSDPTLLLTVGRFGYRMVREDELVAEDELIDEDKLIDGDKLIEEDRRP
jgi:hypothetical protein